jgi:hypothetical protein
LLRRYPDCCPGIFAIIKNGLSTSSFDRLSFNLEADIHGRPQTTEAHENVKVAEVQSSHVSDLRHYSVCCPWENCNNCEPTAKREKGTGAAGRFGHVFNVGPWQNRNLFKALSHAIQHHFIHGNAPYPVERTLLATGILDASMHSRHEAGKVMRTPELEFAYRAIDFRAMREMGASWKIITEDIPEPRGINPNGTES